MKRFLRILKRIMVVILSVATILAITVAIYLQQPQFGKSPSGERLERIKKSPNYRDGEFRNLIETPTLSEGHSILGEIYKIVFKKYPRREPTDSLPSVRTDLKAIPIDSNVMVWFGHSSVYIQIGGKRILVDPVFSGKASPLPASVKAYKGSNTYTAGDMPAIDYLLISHDHYDHLDYETVLALKDKVKFVVCGLGVGADFEYWGYKPDQILEKDWNEKIESGNNFIIFTETSHHGSGRTLRQANTLWMSYLIQSGDMKIYISGDGGYDNRFAEIGAKYGGVDWAIMECGQYDSAWHSVHDLPEEVVKATLGLKARNLAPVHNSKFTLSKQPWDEPLKRITELSQKQAYRLVTPMMGEPVNLNSSTQLFKQWWIGIN